MGHAQVNPVLELAQTPPLVHGDDAQESTVIWQLTPKKPVRHVQVKPVAAVLQRAPFRHGCEAHESNRFWQFVPE